jgi:hypothetical protein
MSRRPVGAPQQLVLIHSGTPAGVVTVVLQWNQQEGTIMLRNSVNPFTVLCLCALLIACASLDERGKAASRNSDAAAVLGKQVETRTVSTAPRERLILKESEAIRDRPHSRFDRELEEELEQEEERGARHRRSH